MLFELSTISSKTKLVVLLSVIVVAIILGVAYFSSKQDVPPILVESPKGKYCSINYESMSFAEKKDVLTDWFGNVTKNVLGYKEGETTYVDKFVTKGDAKFVDGVFSGELLEHGYAYFLDSIYASKVLFTDTNNAYQNRVATQSLNDIYTQVTPFTWDSKATGISWSTDSVCYPLKNPDLLREDEKLIFTKICSGQYSSVWINAGACSTKSLDGNEIASLLQALEDKDVEYIKNFQQSYDLGLYVPQFYAGDVFVDYFIAPDNMEQIIELGGKEIEFLTSNVKSLSEKDSIQFESARNLLTQKEDYKECFISNGYKTLVNALISLYPTDPKQTLTCAPRKQVFYSLYNNLTYLVAKETLPQNDKEVIAKVIDFLLNNRVDNCVDEVESSTSIVNSALLEMCLSGSINDLKIFSTSNQYSIQDRMESCYPQTVIMNEVFERSCVNFDGESLLYTGKEYESDGNKTVSFRVSDNMRMIFNLEMLNRDKEKNK